MGSKTGSRDGRTKLGGVWSSSEKLEDEGEYRLRLERGGAGRPSRLPSLSSDCSTETPANFLLVLDANSVSLNQYHNLRSRP